MVDAFAPCHSTANTLDSLETNLKRANSVGKSISQNERCPRVYKHLIGPGGIEPPTYPL